MKEGDGYGDNQDIDSVDSDDSDGLKEFVDFEVNPEISYGEILGESALNFKVCEKEGLTRQTQHNQEVICHPVVTESSVLTGCDLPGAVAGGSL